MKMKTYEIFTTKFSSIQNAFGIMEALKLFLIDHSVDDECYIIAIVEKTHDIAVEFGIK